MALNRGLKLTTPLQAVGVLKRLQSMHIGLDRRFEMEYPEIHLATG